VALDRLPRERLEDGVLALGGVAVVDERALLPVRVVRGRGCHCTRSAAPGTSGRDSPARSSLWAAAVGAARPGPASWRGRSIRGLR
jgi:hypothetical protein